MDRTNVPTIRTQAPDEPTPPAFETSGPDGLEPPPDYSVSNAQQQMVDQTTEALGMTSFDPPATARLTL